MLIFISIIKYKYYFMWVVGLYYYMEIDVVVLNLFYCNSLLFLSVLVWLDKNDNVYMVNY